MFAASGCLEPCPQNDWINLCSASEGSLWATNAMEELTHGLRPLSLAVWI